METPELYAGIAFSTDGKRSRPRYISTAQNFAPVIEFDSLPRLVQTLTATTQTLLSLATWAAGREVGTEQLTPTLLARRRQIIVAIFDAADDF
jgi:hypothetical protein